MSSRILLCGAAVAVAFIGAPAQSAERCYDFSRLAVGTTYNVGDEIDISIGKVRIREFFIDGELYAPQAATQFIKVNQSQIAQGVAPELQVSLVNIQVIPDQPVTKVTMKVAQQLGVTGQLPANLGVNGDFQDFRGSFNQADGQTIGKPLLGRAQVRVSLVPDPSTPTNPSYWQRGTLGLRAVSGAIKTLQFGAQAMNVDEICFQN